MRCYELRSFAPDGLVAAERPEPSPGPGEVLVAVRACSLNYRDLLMARGHYNPRLPLPRIPLSDAAGEVVALGPGVEGLAVGQRVASCFFQRWSAGEPERAGVASALGGEAEGVLAEKVALRAEGVVPVPEHLSFAEAATLPCAGLTAWNALFELGLRPGETVLVQGSGGVSVFALQFAVRAGARVIATSKSDEKLARLAALGAAYGVNYQTTPDWERAVLELTGGVGVDHVVEVGGAGTLARSFKATRLGGRIAVVGVLAGAQAEMSHLPVIMRALRVQGVFVGSRTMFLAMNRFVGLHKLRPVIDKAFSFDEARAALDHLASGRHFGKVVIEL